MCSKLARICLLTKILTTVSGQENNPKSNADIFSVSNAATAVCAESAKGRKDRYRQEMDMCGNRSNRLAFWFVVPSRLCEMMRAQYCYQCSPSSVKAFAAKFMFERSNATRTSQLAGRPCLENHSFVVGLRLFGDCRDGRPARTLRRDGFDFLTRSTNLYTGKG